MRLTTQDHFWIFLPSYEVCSWFPILSPGDRGRYNIFISYKIFKHLQRANPIFFLLFPPSFFGPHCAACWRRQWHPTPVLLPRKSHGWRSLRGCSRGVARSRARPSDFTFTFHFHSLEKEMATHSSVLAWRIPGTGEPGGLPSMGSHRVRHD